MLVKSVNNKCKNLHVYLIGILYILNAFHHEIYNGYLMYYRELFFFIFTLLIYFKLIVQRHGFINYKWNKDLLLLLLFPISLLIFSFFDNGISLYDDEITGASISLNFVDAKLYIIRNSIIYLPLVIYLSIIRLSSVDILVLIILIFCNISKASI